MQIGSSYLSLRQKAVSKGLSLIYIYILPEKSSSESIGEDSLGEPVRDQKILRYGFVDAVKSSGTAHFKFGDASAEILFPTKTGASGCGGRGSFGRIVDNATSRPWALRKGDTAHPPL